MSNLSKIDLNNVELNIPTGGSSPDSGLNTRVEALENKVNDWDGKYEKPSTGIPKSDLDTSVQNTLTFASTVNSNFGLSGLQTLSTNATKGAQAYTALDGHTVATNVPANAVFTDTIYDDTSVKTRLTNIENQETVWNNKQDAISDLATIRYNASNVPFITRQVTASTNYTLNGTGQHTYEYMIITSAAGINTINVRLASDSATNSVAGWQHYLLIYNNNGGTLNIVIGTGLAATKSIYTIGHAQMIELAWMVHYETNKYNYVLTGSDTLTWLS